MERLMTKKQCADYLQVSISTLEKLVRQGLPYIQWDLKCKRFLRDAIDEWLKLKVK